MSYFIFIICIEASKKLSKKEQKAKEDAEFEAMMAGLATDNKPADESKKEESK